MKNRILQEFLNSNIKIKSKKKLIQYIDYCTENNKKTKILNNDGYSKVAYHHILPKSLFPCYKNLSENPWNGVYLLYSDHYYAHFLLCGVYDNKNYKMNEAFLGMHDRDVPIGRIIEQDLIEPEEFQIFYEEAISLRGIEMSKWFSAKVILEDGIETTNAKINGEKISKTKSSKEWKETKGKIASMKLSNTVKKEFINEDGEITSIAKETGRKISNVRNSIKWKEEIGYQAVQKQRNTITKEFINEDGEITSIAKETGKILSKNKTKKGKFYRLINIFSGIVDERISANELRKISHALHKKSKDDYLGKSNNGRVILLKKNKENLIGLYTELIK